MNIALIPVGDGPPRTSSRRSGWVGRWGDAEEAKRVLVEAIERGRASVSADG